MSSTLTEPAWAVISDRGYEGGGLQHSEACELVAWLALDGILGIVVTQAVGNRVKGTAASG